MNKAFCTLLILCLFSSCTSNDKKSNTNRKSLKGNPISQSSALVAKFKPILQGAWVNKAYIEEVARTRSPFLAVNKVGNISTILIDTSFIKGDTLLTDVGFGDHEGGNFVANFSQGGL